MLNESYQVRILFATGRQGNRRGRHALLAIQIMGFLPFPGGKLQLENGPKSEEKQTYLPPINKVTVLTSSATNVNVRLNFTQLLILDHVRPVKIAVHVGQSNTLDKKL